jgi:hypothetical protein
MTDKELIRLALDVGFIHGRFAKVAESSIDDSVTEDIALLNSAIKECVHLIRGADGEKSYHVGNG